MLDHRGQGNSQRLLKDKQLGHVVDFENYVKDMKQFVSLYVPREKKRILIGYSMGGAIASLYVEQNPNDFNALVLSSPMHQPDILFSSITNVACEVVALRKRDIDRYIIGEKSYDDSEHNFDANPLTHSKIRYEVSKIAFDIEPSAKLGGPSVRWLNQACKGSAKSVEEASKIKIPVLLLQAQNDVIVNKEAQNIFCKNVGKSCKGYQIDGAYHELFVEKDTIREKALTAVLDFISKI
ncbi:alpha/beta fold hydrolase [Sulfurimonas sp. SAG-AH-194-C21]|nr:alpha/beta fold hydrolase [Sulfurimonas sp. SAG-AH-194-C21]MDF1882431.1 alpha/beta fold hydrolase [Sulfurimonas sp. SAG-AH-194-C21]